VKTSYEAGKFQRKTNRDAEEAKIQEIASKGVTVVRDVDRESFKKAMAPIYDQFKRPVQQADHRSHHEREVIKFKGRPFR